MITSQAEAGSYAGLDIATKVIFGWALMLSLKSLHKVQDKEEAEYVSSVSSTTTTSHVDTPLQPPHKHKASHENSGLYLYICYD